MEKLLNRFDMSKCKPIFTSIAAHFNLTVERCPKKKEKIAYIRNVPYSSAVGNSMFAMVCYRPDVAYAMSIVSRYISNPSKKHWDATKWLLRYFK